MENWIFPFILGVGSSVVASLLLSFTILTWKKTRNNSIKRYFLKKLNLGIQNVYKNRKESKLDMDADYEKSNSIRVITNRGFPFSDPSYSENSPHVSSVKKVKILLLNPYSESAKNRASEIIKMDKSGWRLEHFQRDIINSAKKLDDHDNIEVKFHAEPSVFRLVLLDNSGYLSGFLRKYFGRDCPVYKFMAGTFLYNLFDKYFDSIWEKSLSMSEFKILEENEKMRRHDS